MASAFQSTHDGLPEPLCAIYEPHSFEALKKHFENGKTCPRKFLMNNEVELIKQPFDFALDNVNSPEEFEKALKVFKR